MLRGFKSDFFKTDLTYNLSCVKSYGVIMKRAAELDIFHSLLLTDHGIAETWVYSAFLNSEARGQQISIWPKIQQEGGFVY